MSFGPRSSKRRSRVRNSMYIERLPSGWWGLYKANGQRVAVHRTKALATRHKVRLMRSK